MQKLINLMAVTSFAVNIGMIVGGVYIYQNKDQIADNVRNQVTREIAESLPGMLNSLMPESPTSINPF